jgi:hypothetical protein
MRPFSVFVFVEVFLSLTRLQAQQAGVEISGAPLPIRVLAQSPTDTTELQVNCLFRSSPVNVWHGHSRKQTKSSTAFWIV